MIMSTIYVHKYFTSYLPCEILVNIDFWINLHV